MITLKNPDNGDTHKMDADAFAELRKAHDDAVKAERDHLVFRAMTLTVSEARRVLAADI